ncbi:hypothetical protein [Streptomyces sp. NPDC021212]|uniref:hypothetical protein n=1 Tax=Streptomyces sp. NPDC021212 TaxID=3365118 RepID=UPI0037AA8C35
MSPGPGRGGHPSTPRGGVDETAVAHAGRERVVLAAGVEALPMISQDWRHTS